MNSTLFAADETATTQAADETYILRYTKNPKVANLVNFKTVDTSLTSSLRHNNIIPREARPKASRSGLYNFVPQRAQAG